MRDPAYDAIKDAYRSLADLAAGITPHNIGGPGFEPEMSDAIAINKELFLLARKVDAVIAAYGEYARSNGIVSDSEISDCFTEVLHGALDGNATYLIEEGTRSRIRDREDEEEERADHDYKIRQTETV